MLKKVIAILCSATIMCSSITFVTAEGTNDNLETENDIFSVGVNGENKIDDEQPIGNNNSDISLFAVGFDGGDGTEENPYLISTEEQLIFVADLPEKCFKLSNSIELQDDWISIGTYGESFSGVFDGDGFTISKMNVTDGGGFFKKVTGEVKNLNVEGTVTSTDTYVGGLAGYSSGTIENCSFSGDVTNNTTEENTNTGGLIGCSTNSVKNCRSFGNVASESNYDSSTVGGLIGFNSKGSITNSFSESSVSGKEYTGGLIGDSTGGVVSNSYATGDAVCNGSSSYTGGLMGFSSATVQQCYASGDISIQSDNYSTYAGGLIGYAQGSIIGSYSIGNINSYTDISSTYEFDYAGGLVGYVYKRNITLKNCFSMGKITAGVGGGLVGLLSNNYGEYKMDITNCYAAESINASTKGGLLGQQYSYKVTVENSYYDSQLSKCTDTIGSPKTTSGMKNQLIYDGWDFDEVWAMDSNGVANSGYPYLRWSLENTAHVTKITLDKSNETVKMGDTFLITPTVEGENIDGIPLEWKTSDKTVATVDNGTVTAKNMGTAVITVSYGSMSASCTVNVTDNTVKVTGVTLDKSKAGIIIGETVSLAATVAPIDATNKDIKWISTDISIATVSSNGVVTGLAEGTAQIYATSASNSQCYAICTVTVAKQMVHVTGIEFADKLFDEPYEVDIDKTLTLTPTIKPSNATNKDIKWTSSDSSVATVINGKVTGISEGTTTITATTVDGGFTASVPVKVTKPTVYITGIALNTEQMTVNVKATKKLIAAVTPTDATNKEITFKSNNNAIANVSADGTVTGVSPGTTLIQAISDTNSGKFVAFCTVTVPKPVIEVTSVKLDKGSLEIVEGKKVPLKAVIKPTNATYKNLTWSTSDESIVTVTQDGQVSAMGVGEAVVSATAVNGVNVVCNVTVLPHDTPAQLKVEDAVVKAGKQIPVTVSIASNPGISTFNFDLTYDNTKLYPVSYTKGDALENVNVVTPLGSGISFEDRNSVRFLCSTTDSKNMDSDGDLITVIFQTRDTIEYGEETIGIVPAAFTNQNYEAINLQEDNCTLQITDYIIGDVNNDDTVDLKDSMILGQYIAGFGIELTPQGKKAAVSIYPDENDNVETSEPSLNDFQHLFRYLADWQVELGKK